MQVSVFSSRCSQQGWNYYSVAHQYQLNRNLFWSKWDSKKKAKQGSLLTDSSSTDPIVWKDLAKEVEKMGAIFRVAPVSDGVEATQSGNLTFMVGSVLC